MMQNVAISTGKIVLYFVLLGALGYGLQVVWPQVEAMLGAGVSLPAMVGIGVANFFVMAVPAMFLMAVFDRKSPAAMGLTTHSSIADFLTGGIVGGFIFVAALAAAFFNGWASFNPDFSKISMAAMAAGAFGMTLASAGEEVMMRGFVLQELMGRFSTPASVIVSSLLFTALHGAQLANSNMAAVGALNIFMASVLLSLAYLATRTLWLPIGIHAGWNVMQGPLLGINVSGTDVATSWHPVTLSGPEMMTGGSFGFEGSVLALIGPTLGILMMLAMRRRST